MSYPKTKYQPEVMNERSLSGKTGKRQSTLAGTNDLLFICTENRYEASGTVYAIQRREEGLPFAWDKPFNLPDGGVVRFPVVWQKENLLLLATRTNAWNKSAHLFCLDTKTGNKLWQYPSNSDESQIVDHISAPVVTSKGVLAVLKRQQTKYPELFFFNAHGEVTQVTSLNHEPLNTPYNLTVDENSLYVAVKTGVAKYSLSDGQHINILSVENGNGIIHAQLAISGDSLFVGTEDGSLAAYDKDTRVLHWSNDVGRAITTGPIVWDGKVFIGSKATVNELEAERNYQILSLDALNGQQFELLSLGKKSHFYAPLVIYQNNLLASSTNGDVYAIDCDTGMYQRIHHMNKAIYCQPYCASADQTIYLADRNANIAELKMECHMVIRAELRKILTGYFSKSELKDICHDLKIKCDSFVGEETTDNISRELILYLDRNHGNLDGLIMMVKQLRPQIAMIDLLGECDE